MSVKIISIEGNIGSGKSTVVHNLEQKLKNNQDYVFLREPVDIWQSIKDQYGKTILEKFYENQDKYSFAFQVMAYATRTAILQEAIRKNPQCKYVLCERSLEADNRIFAKMLFDDNKMEKVEYEIYEYFYKTRKQDMNLDAVIYIDADAETCLERIKKRSRNGETNISLEYLQNCKDYHDKWLLGDKECYKDFTLYANVSYYHLNMPCLNSMYRGNNLENLKILHVNANPNATYSSDDRNDIGNKWLDTMEEFIYEL
tara:strand:+ start:3318 stop:4088 length:771 start_codon:yes stop_codon:yes gene_type:complete